MKNEMSIQGQLNVVGYSLLGLGWLLFGILDQPAASIVSMPIFIVATGIFAYNIYLGFRK